MRRFLIFSFLIFGCSASEKEDLQDAGQDMGCQSFYIFEGGKFCQDTPCWDVEAGKCGLSGCQEIGGSKLNDLEACFEQPESLGCAPQELIHLTSIYYAKDSAGNCFEFGSHVLPKGWQMAAECRGPMRCPLGPENCQDFDGDKEGCANAGCNTFNEGPIWCYKKQTCLVDQTSPGFCDHVPDKTASAIGSVSFRTDLGIAIESEKQTAGLTDWLTCPENESGSPECQCAQKEAFDASAGDCL